MSSLSIHEKRDWLRLARTQNVGPVTFAALVARFGSATAALQAVPKLAQRGGATSCKVPSSSDADRELEVLDRLGGKFIASCEPEFPPGLAALDPPPPVIAVLGDRALLSREMIAIVGARNASALGRRFAATLASDFGRTGLVIASGMARGIDAAAHEAAVTTGTCAVLAGGVDVIYPPENARLYERIARKARWFPKCRWANRLCPGISRGAIGSSPGCRAAS